VPSGADLVLVGHGSRNPRAGRVLHGLRDAVAKRLPGRLVQLAWLELNTPLLTDVLADRSAQAANPPVVVPLLLSRGTHVSRDLPPEATPPLGPDPLLTEALLDRIHTTGIRPGRPLVLAAAGSRDPSAVADVIAQAGLLEAAWHAPVRVGLVTATPSVADAMQALERVNDTDPAVVSYFLAPGRLPSSAQPDTAHLGDHPALVDLVVARYRSAVRARACSAQALAHTTARACATPPFAPDGVTRMGL
jgi:sirohydrochlorin ferrochelatase